MEYQIEQIWGDGAKVWDYFNSDADQDGIAEEAIEIVKQQHQKRLDRKRWDMFANTDPSRPTIIIREYPRKRGGVLIKTKWR